MPVTENLVKLISITGSVKISFNIYLIIIKGVFIEDLRDLLSSYFVQGWALSTFGHQENTNTNSDHSDFVNKIQILAILKWSIKSQDQFWACAEQFPNIRNVNQY